MLLVSAPVAAATYRLPSTPETVHRSVLSPDFAAVLKVRSGDTVVIDTVSHGGLTTGDPVTFFAAEGIAEKDVLKDAAAIAKIPYDKSFGGHVLTGPIAIEGAEPGDMLEVRIKAVKPRVGYGVNNAGNGVGAAPDLLPAGTPNSRVIKYDSKRAHFAPGISFPLRPFLGTMAVAPTKPIPSRAPASMAAISISRSCRPVRRCTCRAGEGRRCSPPAIPMQARATAKSAAMRWNPP